MEAELEFLHEQLKSLKSLLSHQDQYIQELEEELSQANQDLANMNQEVQAAFSAQQLTPGKVQGLAETTFAGQKAIRELLNRRPSPVVTPSKLRSKQSPTNSNARRTNLRRLRTQADRFSVEMLRFNQLKDEFGKQFVTFRAQVTLRDEGGTRVLMKQE